MICSSVNRFFTSNLLASGNWTPNRRATRNRGDVDAAVNLWNENEATAEASTSAIGSNAPEIMEPEQTKIVREPAAQEAITVQQDGQPVVAPPRLIEIGMDAETVRSIQGDPVQWEGSEWIYGPSWIRFERGRVIDWYSSPLRRLKTETSSP